MNGTDKLKYEKVRDLGSLQRRVKTKSVKEFSNDVWLPDKPEIIYLMEDKKNEIKEKHEERNREARLTDKAFIQR